MTICLTLYTQQRIFCYASILLLEENNIMNIMKTDFFFEYLKDTEHVFAYILGEETILIFLLSLFCPEYYPWLQKVT